MKNKKYNTIEDIFSSEEKKIFIDEPKKNCAIIDSQGFILMASPVFAGRYSEFFLTTLYSNKHKKDIEKIVLMEDDIEIHSSKSDFLSYDIEGKDKGTHKYHAAINLLSGEVINTDSINIEYTGQEIDFKPYFQNFFALGDKGKGINILIEARDIGDNKGIKRITLYEDNKAIKTVNEHSLFKTIEYESRQSHIYHAQAEDIGGNKARTEDLRAEFSGDAFEPKIKWFHANPRSAGKTTMILAEAEDPKNYDSKKGIEHIILYEDGRELLKKDSDYLLLEVTKEAPEEHIYQAKAINNNGIESYTEEIPVNFTGVDFPPEIRFWHISYKPDENIATVLVEAEDKKNVREECGIKNILLYEDNRAINEVKSDTLITDLKKRSGKHTYYAIVTNNSGIKSATEEIVIGYTG